MQGKYAPLHHHIQALTKQGIHQWHATFDQIENILGDNLPPSARQHQAWWANDSGGSHPHAQTWLSQNWHTHSLNLANETISFERNPQGKYAPLHHHIQALTKQGIHQWHATFDQIENILGDNLPPSARQHQAWWANDSGGSHPHAQTWLSQNWHTHSLNLANETISFERNP